MLKKHSTTPALVTQHIERLCDRLGLASKPEFIRVISRADSGDRDCFNDVLQQVSEQGGKIVYGWQFWEWPKVFVEAEFHAVWERPDGALIDVQHKPDGERAILFVRDDKRVFDGNQVDNERLAISLDWTVSEWLGKRAQFQHAFIQRHPGVVGAVVLEPDLARIYDDVLRLEADVHERHACGLI